MERNLFDTFGEAIEDIEDREGEHDVVLLPLANYPYASDEEVGDDDIGFGGVVACILIRKPENQTRIPGSTKEGHVTFVKRHASNCRKIRSRRIVNVK